MMQDLKRKYKKLTSLMLPKVSKNDAKFEQTTIEPIRKQYRLINTTTILPKHYILAPAFFYFFYSLGNFISPFMSFFILLTYVFLVCMYCN